MIRKCFGLLLAICCLIPCSYAQSQPQSSTPSSSRKWREIFQDFNKTGKFSPEDKELFKRVGAFDTGKNMPQEGIFLGGADLNKGREFLAQKKIAEAEALFKKVLALRQQKYGSADALLIEPLCALGRCAEVYKQWNTALQYYQQAASVGRSVISSQKNSDPRETWDQVLATIVDAFNGEARVALAMNSYKEAESACKEAMAIEDSGRSQPAAMCKGTTVQTYAELLRRTGYLQKSIDLQQSYRKQMNARLQQMGVQAAAPPR